MTGRKTLVALIAANAAVWGLPAAIYGYLFAGQAVAGNGSVFLFIIAPLPFFLGFLLATAGPALLMRFGRQDHARMAAIVLCIAGVPLAGCGILMLGST